MSLRYKILWVDDDTSIGSSFVMNAAMKGVEVVQFYSWDKAEEELRRHFEVWDAVILDAHCVLEEGGAPNDLFLAKAVGRLMLIYGEKKSRLPWYVLSAGTKVLPTFNELIGYTKMQAERPEEWGDLVHLKISEGIYDAIDLLLGVVVKAVDSMGDKVERRHRGFFEAMKSLGLDMGSDLKGLLMPLYDADAYAQFEVQRHRAVMRIVVEALFRKARDLGMVPDDFMNEKEEFVDLSGTSRYLAGKPSKSVNAESTKAFFPEWVANILQGVLHIEGSELHHNEEFNSVHLMSGYALQLTEVVVWFSALYEREKDDEDAIAANKACRQYMRPSAEEEEKYLNKVFVVEKTAGVAHVDKGMVPSRLKAGVKVKVTSVAYNKVGDTEKYPYFFNVITCKKDEDVS